MNYSLKTRGYTEEKTLKNFSEGTPIKSLGSAIEKILEILEYRVDDIAEIVICNDLGKAVYSVKPTGNRSFHVTELF